jgi:hypothetical protein
VRIRQKTEALLRNQNPIFHTQKQTVMAYVTTDDLKQYLDQQEIEALRRDYEDDGIDKLPQAITYAENYVADRLAQMYDIRSELAKAGTSRNTTLQGIIAHIAIWNLCASFPTVQLDGKRHYHYDQALAMLAEIEKGKLLAAYLPAWPQEPRRGEVVWGSNENIDIKF